MVATTAWPVTPDWVSVGDGPWQVYATGPGATYAIADDEPPATLTHAFPVPYAAGDADTVLSESQVWIRATGNARPIVFFAEIEMAGRIDLSEYVLKAGDTMEGDLTLAGPPTAPLHAATRGYVDEVADGLLPLDGVRPMTGDLTLARDPTDPLHAATMQYVDDAVAVDTGVFLRKAGDTMTGPLVLAADPVAALEAATRAYVDRLVTGAPHFIGTVNAATGFCDYTPGSGFPDGALVDPTTTIAGSFLICNVAGNHPSLPSPMEVNDILISDANTWTFVSGQRAVILASTVVVQPPVFNSGNVQGALEQSKVEVDAALAAANAANTNANTRVLRAGDAMTGGLAFGSIAQQDQRDISRHVALWGGGTTGFGLGITGGNLNVVAAANASNFISLMAGTKTTPTARVSNTGVELLVTPTADNHAATLGQVNARPNEPPNNTTIHGRRGSDRTWQPVLPLTGGTLTGNLTVQGQDLVSRLNSTANNARATLSFGAGANDHFQIYRNNGATSLHIDRFPTDGGAASPVLNVNRANGAITLGGGSMLTLTGPPTVDLHAATKAYVDTTAAGFSLVQWTTGANYAVGQQVLWDGLPFRVTTAIANAPAVPNFTTIRLSVGQQGDYWRGTPGGWANGNWIQLATLAPYGTYRMQFDALINQADESFILDIACSYNAGRIVITSLAHNPNGFPFNQFRLSGEGLGQANPVRLEARISTAGTGPDFKIFVAGFARQNNSNTTVIPKPPTGQAANLGGTEYAVLDIETGSTGSNATPAFVAGTIQTGVNGWIRFPHANTTNRDDGRISVRLHNRGLNIVGSATEASDVRRYVSVYGHVDMIGSDGLGMGSATATAPRDLTRHIALFGGSTPTSTDGFGFSVTTNTLNYITAATNNQHDFYIGANHVARLNDGGITVQGARTLNFGNNLGTDLLDTSRHVRLYGTGTGVAYSAANLNIVAADNNNQTINLMAGTSATAAVGVHATSGVTVARGGVQINAGNFRQLSTSNGVDGGQVHQWMDASNRVTGEIRVAQNGTVSGTNHQGSLEFRVNTGTGIQRVAYTRYGAAPRLALDNDPVNAEDVATKRYVDASGTSGSWGPWLGHPVNGANFTITGARLRTRFVDNGQMIQIEGRAALSSDTAAGQTRQFCVPGTIPVERRPPVNQNRHGVGFSGVITASPFNVEINSVGGLAGSVIVWLTAGSVTLNAGQVVEFNFFYSIV